LFRVLILTLEPVCGCKYRNKYVSCKPKIV